MRTSWTRGASWALSLLLLAGCGEGFHNEPLQLAEVRGRVVGADPALASVTVLLEDNGGGGDAGVGDDDGGEALLTTGVDAEGRFVLRDVPATRLTLYVVGSPGRATELTVDAPGGRVTDVGDVVLADAANITVHVQDVDGNPIPGAEVDVDETPFDRQTVDAAGNAHFGPLAPGCYRVRARAQDYEDAELSACVAEGQSLQLSLALPLKN
jgi:hypothetical protein